MPKSVFINCPFDKEYRHLLHLMGFVLVYLDYDVQISRTKDGTSNRLDQIIQHIQQADFIIHDISRMKSQKENEMARFNMPFELGIDIGVKSMWKGKPKYSLVLDIHPYRYRESLSDLAGCDIENYGTTDQEYRITQIIRQWLIKHDTKALPPANLLKNAYRLFFAELVRNLKKQNWTKRDIDHLEFTEYIYFAKVWVDAYKNTLNQEDLNHVLEPHFEQGKNYRKTVLVWARQAKEGEMITTITSDGTETHNFAQEGDFVVKNNTQAQEYYIVSQDVMPDRYQATGKKNRKWNEYQAIGKIQAIPFDRQIQFLLDVQEQFDFLAPWGTKMNCKLHDYLAKPLHSNEIYRIAKKEFLETYQEVK